MEPDPAPPIPNSTPEVPPVFAEAVAIMAHLRSKDGCPWDQEQTFDSIRKYTLEETYEVFDAIERRDWPNLQEELGDLLLQVLFYAQMAADAGYFSITDVVSGLNRKLIRRHPHVFGESASLAAGNAVTAPMEIAGIGAPQVLRNWEAIKQAEKALATEKANASVLDGVSRALPALVEAAKIGAKAQKQGFDWPETDGIFAKLEEETAELREALSRHVPGTGEIAHEEVVSEVGDMFFTLVNLARRLSVDPEFALRNTNGKFRRRFAAMESASSQPLASLSLDQLEALWKQAKDQENPLPAR